MGLETVITLEQWQNMQLPNRQQLLLDFYHSNNPDLAHTFLDFVRAPQGWGVFASAGPNYQAAIFGRDSVQVAEDLLVSRPDLAKEIILTLARLQGDSFTLDSEESSGKIHHEYRRLDFDGHPVPPAARKVFEHIWQNWGGGPDEMCYYGALDPTPLFVRLVSAYSLQEGRDFLQHKIPGKDITIGQAVKLAVELIAERIVMSPWGLLEYKRLNPHGLYNQAWEDSDMAYIHTDGSLANSKDGIAAIEIQGYAYDALHLASKLVTKNKHEAIAWQELANMLQRNVLQAMYIPEGRYFAMGLDRSPEGQTRQIATINSNPALLMDSEILVHLPDDQRQHYIESIAYTIFSNEFMTEVGPRLRAKKHLPLVAFADYHGAQVSWPKQTYDIAKGLRRHGLPHLAEFLEDCILQSVLEAGEFYEFFLVDAEGVPKHHYRFEDPTEPNFHEFGAANIPEPGQAWTISAVLGIITYRHTHRHKPEPTILESAILQLPQIKKIKSKFRL